MKRWLQTGSCSKQPDEKVHVSVRTVQLRNDSDNPEAEPAPNPEDPEFVSRLESNDSESETFDEARSCPSTSTAKGEAGMRVPQGVPRRFSVSMGVPRGVPRDFRFS